ncbi:MAG: glycine cleavage system aminomethyltransferase GcvT [Pseudomonadota bacterium]|nr:glycine cleavage system aminomethyltransferase GcvT [Pseudomonadota bacterium]
MITSLKTALHDIHQALNGRFITYAGYEMPVQYSDGVLQEHKHTRASCGVFDVSHMGQILISPGSGSEEDLTRSLEMLVPSDLFSLPENKQCYSLLTNSSGGVIDDLIITKCKDYFFLVCNASRKSLVFEHLRLRLGEAFKVQLLDNRALFAVQGPLSDRVLTRFSSHLSDMNFLDFKIVQILGTECWVSRSGYTGEDGFEISVENSRAEAWFKEILSCKEIKPVGLGARDSLRLEAGLCLYGNELSETITPVEADLGWVIHKARRVGGSRSGGFLGEEIILRQLNSGASQKRVGLLPIGRAPMRAGCKIFGDKHSSTEIGSISSGGFSPILNKPISMAILDTTFSKPGTKVCVELRGNRLLADVTCLPFVSHNYKSKKGNA